MALIVTEDMPSHGLHVVQGELSILLNSMRRPFKWSSQIYQEEEHDVLIKNLNQLKEKLNRVSSLTELDFPSILGPFLEVIRSEDTSGPVTELALSAVFKFLSYNLIDPQQESTAFVVESIADAVTHARFVGTDSGNDEVVLMKILHVLRMLVLHPAGVLLSNESICEIMQSCFRICFEMRLSELLRKSAEQSLSEMVRLLYARLPQFPLQEAKGSVNYKKLKMRTAAYDPSRNKKKSRSPKPRPKTLPVAPASNGGPNPPRPNSVAETPVSSVAEAPVTRDVETIGVESPAAAEPVPLDSTSLATRNLNTETAETVDGNVPSGMSAPVSDEPLSPVNATDAEYVNAQGVRFTVSESVNEQESGRSHIPYGLPCVRELLRFLISLINPLEKQNTEAMVHIGLRLLTVAVETGADTIAAVPSLMALIQDETCRYLFALVGSERISLLAAACRLCFLLFESARTRLKFQLETYLLKLMEIVAHESPKVAYERRLVALEAIAHLCRIPGLVTELYINYDCDCHSSDLFEELIKHLSKNVSPVAGGIYAIHLLSLETLLIVADSIEAHCISNQANRNLDDSSSETAKAIQLPPAARKSRLESSARVPSQEELMAVRRKKKLLITGAEQFNAKAANGVQFLQKNGLLSDPLDPNEVATLLRSSSRLDKKMIGEYLSNRKNLAVLQAFVRSFDFRGMRIDESLRLYLETFRLPGESPLISLLMEQFADHWFRCNDAPFCNADAAFTLAYGVIMLNVDQHNQNVKRQNLPMTAEEFKRNLSKVNGGQDFDQTMLDEIYLAIRNEEIVMPAEQTGLVKENYIWKVLLRRGATKDGLYVHAPNGLFDRDLFDLSWVSTMSALGCLLDKAPSDGSGMVEWVLLAMRKVATVAAHFCRSDVFDNIVEVIVKFSTLLGGSGGGDHPSVQAVAFGNNRKAQLATATVFQLVQRHGDILRLGWKHVVDCILQLYRLRILPDELVEAEDPLDPAVKVKLVSEETTAQRSETSGLFSSLYSYISLSDGPAGGRTGSVEEQEALKRAKSCVVDCNIEQLIADSKFLQPSALRDFVLVLISSANASTPNADEHCLVFVLELIIRITVQNRDRVIQIWTQVRDHIYSLLMMAAASERHFVLERSIVGLLVLNGRLMRREDVAPIVLQSLRMLLMLKPQVLSRVSRQVSYGLHELLKTGAANVHTTGDWRVLFTLLECVGAGAQPPSKIASLTPSNSLDAISDGTLERACDVASTDRGYTADSELYTESRSSSSARSPTGPSGAHGSSPQLNLPAAAPVGGGGWIFVGREGEIEHLRGKQAPGQEYNIVHDRKMLGHDPLAFVKSCESLAFLIRDVAHITPENFEVAVSCIRTFVEASLNGGRQAHAVPPAQGGQRSQKADSFRRSKSTSFSGTGVANADESDVPELPSNYHQVPMQLLDLMHTLHTRAANIYQWWASESEEAGETQGQPGAFSLWNIGWCPLLQGIARLCCDSRKQVRTTAITYLQRSLLVHDLQSLLASEWESCFNTVLFPLLGKLLEPVSPHPPAVARSLMMADQSHWEETRIRAATLLSKVFLQHLGPLMQLPTFTALWLTLLDVMDRYMHAEHNDLLAEAVPEMMKNLLLVMETAGVFGTADDEDQVSETDSVTGPPKVGVSSAGMRTQLWNLTCDRIDVFLPGLKQEIARSRTPVPRMPTESAARSSLPAEQPVEVAVPELTEAIPDAPVTPYVQLTEQPTEQQEEVGAPSIDIADPAADGDLRPAVPQPAEVFSLWNVPEPSDTTAFFFHNSVPVDDGPASVESASIETENRSNSGLDYTPLPILPIPLMSAEDESTVLPLSVFSSTVECPPIPVLENDDREGRPSSDAVSALPLLLTTGEETARQAAPFPLLTNTDAVEVAGDHHV